MRTLMVIITLTSMASVAAADGGTIGLFADTEGIECNITDIVPGLVEVHVVHKTTAGAVASRFAAPVPNCMVAHSSNQTG